MSGISNSLISLYHELFLLLCTNAILLKTLIELRCERCYMTQSEVNHSGDTQEE